MTKKEAIEAMKTQRVRHRYFSSDEWVTQCSNGKYYFEDGCSVDPEVFWKCRTAKEWEEGWEVIPSPERCVG